MFNNLPDVSLQDGVNLELDNAVVQLDEIATVKRGIQTGGNDYFCLTHEEVQEAGLPEEVLAPLLRSTSLAPHYTYEPADWRRNLADGKDGWLLYHTDDLDRPAAHDAVEQYLAEAEADNLHEDTYTFRNRDPWYVVDRRSPPDIVFTYMSRGGVRFIYNVAEARSLNNTHGIWLDESLSLVDKLALMGYLNSPMVDAWLSSRGRTYSTGLDKVEPDTLKDLPVVNPRSLPLDVCEELGQLFHKLDETSRDSTESGATTVQRQLELTIRSWYADALKDELDAALNRYKQESATASLLESGWYSSSASAD